MVNFDSLKGQVAELLSEQLGEKVHKTGKGITGELAVNAVLDAIETSLLNHGGVKLANFGKFTVVERAARKGRNPQTGEELQIEAYKAVKFKPSEYLKEAVKA